MLAFLVDIVPKQLAARGEFEEAIFKDIGVKREG